MKPEDFLDDCLIGNRSTHTGIGKLSGFVYKNVDVHCLDIHGRCRFNFAAVLNGRYVEFSTAKAAKKAIRGAF